MRARTQGLQLIDQMPDIFERLLEEGRSALARNESAEAQRKLEAALLIHPENAPAMKSLKRAKTLDEVLRLVSSGEQLEKDHKFTLAYTDYQKAVSLDPLHSSAHKGLQRVEKRIKTDH